MGVEKMGEVYKCEICGNIVEVLDVGGGDLICCGEKMKRLEEKTEDIGKEKHVPVVEKTETGIRVKVGSIEHPMEEKHFIEWIEVISNGKSCKEFLKPGMKPEAEFCITELEMVRIYCNIHGLWKNNS